MMQKIENLSVNVLGWNAFSKQFIDTPTFKLLPRPETKEYRATVTQGDARFEIRSSGPVLDLRDVWSKVAIGRFEINIEWLDGSGKSLFSIETDYKKAPDWSGLKEPALDWAASADRNVAFLIDAADNHPTTYREPGVPVWVWNAIAPGDSGQPMRQAVGYPALHMPLMIRAFVARAAGLMCPRPEARM